MTTGIDGTRAAVRLHCRAADSISLRDALAHAPTAGAVALLSTPQAFVIATVRENSRCTTVDTDAPLDDVFEARVFTPDAELRWTATFTGTAGATGRAALLTENPALLPAGPFGEEVAVIEAVDTIGARYLLWGRPVPDDPAPDGWITLHTPRIGVLRVPAPASGTRPSPQERVQLAAREYVCTEPRHGNAYVAEERLLRLETTRPERRERPRG
jgi:CRISPR-associated protein (TIGR03984 family)